MADGDPESLRKQIAFLSNLINNHKSGIKSNEKRALSDKSSENLKSTRPSRSWKRYAVDKNKIPLYNTNDFKHRAHDLCYQTERQNGVASKNKSSFQSVSLPSNKFAYRSQPSQSSVDGTRSVTSSDKRNIMLEMRQAVSCSTTHSGKHLTVLKSEPQVAYHCIKNKTVTISPNKYKLQKNNDTVKQHLKNITGQHLPASHEAVAGQSKKVCSKVSARLSVKKETSGNNLRQSQGSFKWLKKHRTHAQLSSTLPNMKMSSQNSSNTVPKKKDLRWRKNTTQSSSSSAKLKQKGLKKNSFQSQGIPKMSELKWQKKSATASNSQTLQRKKQNACQPQTMPKKSKLRWRRKSVVQSNSLLDMKSKVTPKKQVKKYLVQKSRYSLKKVVASQEKAVVHNDSMRSNTWNWYGHSAMQNRGFVARRMKYMYNANGLHVQHSGLPSTKIESHRTVKIRGNNYTVGSQGKSLHKKHKTNKTIFLNGRKVRHSRPRAGSMKLCKPVPRTVHRTFVRQHSVEGYKSQQANKILKRSVQNVQASLKKKNQKKLKSEQYCMFYNKFGKCAKQKQGICPFIHDPSKIAVCTRFLRGTCQQIDGSCPFSHKIDKEKMPICQYFLKGKCTKDDCPYSHVNVGPRAGVCEDFLRGYCALGFKCKKKHVLECEEFNMTGQCPRGTKCKLIHRKKTRPKKRYFQEVSSPEEGSDPGTKKARTESSDGFLPLEVSTLVDADEGDRATKTVADEQENVNTRFSLQIRPKFTTKTCSDGSPSLQDETLSGN